MLLFKATCIESAVYICVFIGNGTSNLGIAKAILFYMQLNKSSLFGLWNNAYQRSLSNISSCFFIQLSLVTPLPKDLRKMGSRPVPLPCWTHGTRQSRKHPSIRNSGEDGWKYDRSKGTMVSLTQGPNISLDEHANHWQSAELKHVNDLKLYFCIKIFLMNEIILCTNVTILNMSLEMCNTITFLEKSWFSVKNTLTNQHLNINGFIVSK